MTSPPSLRFGEAAELSFDRLVQLADRDWAVAAGPLDWSCRKTLGHLTDCVFGYAMQLAVLGERHWLPFEELRLLDDATNDRSAPGLPGHWSDVRGHSRRCLTRGDSI